MTGTVYLVGAGPGDPGLLTLKGARLLEAADVVVYDQLVGDAILDRLPAGVERIYAGKETGSHTMDQAAINAVLTDRARSGRTVVRLKGGDPFVFGRGGEEAEYLAERGIPFEVVPGVTSAVGVPAYAGIPVTHRGVAASVAVVTGRAGPAGEAPAVDWARVAGADTVVVLMGVANQETLVRALIDGGRSPETPVAAIRWGTTAQQRVVTGTLDTIGERLRAANLRSPAILVVGDVVGLRPRILWASSRPLFGRRVLVPSAYPSSLTAPLESLGAEVLHVLPVEHSPPPSWAPLDQALDGLRALTGVVFADGAGAGAVRERLVARGHDARALAGLRIVATSRSAAHELRAFGIRADAVIEEASPDWAPGGASESWLVVGSPDAQQAVAASLARQGARVIGASGLYGDDAQVAGGPAAGRAHVTPRARRRLHRAGRGPSGPRGARRRGALAPGVAGARRGRQVDWRGARSVGVRARDSHDRSITGGPRPDARRRARPGARR